VRVAKDVGPVTVDDDLPRLWLELIRGVDTLVANPDPTLMDLGWPFSGHVLVNVG